jgi:hypothetical protein
MWIEGEEEIGSKSLSWFVERNQEKLKTMFFNFRYGNDLKQPSITTGLRGFELCRSGSYGTKPRLAFGLYGGAVANPINAIKMIASRREQPHHHSGFMTMLRNILEEKSRNGQSAL